MIANACHYKRHGNRLTYNIHLHYKADHGRFEQSVVKYMYNISLYMYNITIYIYSLRMSALTWCAVWLAHMGA